MNKRRLLAILLCLVLLLPLAACANTQDSSLTESGESQTGSDQGDASSAGGSSDSPDAAASGKDTITIALRNDAGSLDASLINTDTYAAVTCIQETLWDLSEENEVIMLLAEDVDQVSDTEWIVHLRQGVTFSNGNPFTADDVIFSIQKHKDSGATGSPRVQTIDAEKTYAIDDYTLSMQLLAPNVANWSITAMLVIYDAESYDPETGSQNPIGTGPYVLKEYVPNSYLNLERREDYWGELPDAKYLNFKILSETSQRVNALETGLVDIAQLATEDVEYANTLEGFNVDSRYTGNYKMIGFNLGENSAYYQNIDARRAVAHAIDPQAIIDAVYLGQGKVMHAAVPELCFDFEERFNDMDDTYAIGYDVALATELAQSSGLAGQTVKLMTDGLADSVKTAEIVQIMLGEIGVTVEINNYDSATVWQMLYDPAAEYDMSIGAGIAPNRRVGDQLLNGVRYSPTMSAPGAFPGVEEYLELAPLCMSTLDEQELSELLFDMLGRYEEYVLHFSTCNILYANAYSTAIDLDSVIYTFGTGSARFADLKFVS